MYEYMYKYAIIWRILKDKLKFHYIKHFQS